MRSDETWQVVVGTFSIRTAVRKGASVETYIWYHNGTQPITPSATLRAEHPIRELSCYIWYLYNQSEQSIFSLMNIVGLIWSLAQSTTYVEISFVIVPTNGMLLYFSHWILRTGLYFDRTLLLCSSGCLCIFAISFDIWS